MSPSLKESGIIALVLIVVLGILERLTSAGQSFGDFLAGIGSGIARLGTGIQTGVSSALSPQISPSLAPSFVPQFGVNICVPAIGLPCTATSRETGNTPGSGSGSSGFGVQPNITLLSNKNPSLPTPQTTQQTVSQALNQAQAIINAQNLALSPFGISLPGIPQSTPETNL